MKDLFALIETFFVEVLFAPFDAIRSLELENWFLANTISWIFVFVAFIAMVYWMIQLKKYNEKAP